jgi:hypothetical protein
MLKIRWIFAIFFFTATLRTRFYVNCRAGKITLGILLPFETAGDFLSDNRQWTKRYAGMIPYAINTVNNDPNLLPNHTLSFVWKDTECRTDKALRGMAQQWSENVDAFIGLGCFCEESARLASALRLPVVSNVSYIYKSVGIGHEFIYSG